MMLKYQTVLTHNPCQNPIKFNNFNLYNFTLSNIKVAVTIKNVLS